MGEPFAVDEDRALSALSLAWGDLYEIWTLDGKWHASRSDAPDEDALTGDTPDEVNRKIRDDWSKRGNSPRGPAGMPPS